MMVVWRRDSVPKIKANNITMNYEQQGRGEPLILIPYLTADHACYAFQVAEYSKHFTCISLDLRGTGESDKPEGFLVCPLERRLECGWQQSTRMLSRLYRCTAVGRKRTLT
jgi:pimeloyl-ACP methyl ester carboxylesterase